LHQDNLRPAKSKVPKKMNLNSEQTLSQNPHLAGDLLTERAGLRLGDALLLADLAGLRL